MAIHFYYLFHMLWCLLFLFLTSIVAQEEDAILEVGVRELLDSIHYEEVFSDMISPFEPNNILTECFDCDLYNGSGVKVPLLFLLYFTLFLLLKDCDSRYWACERAKFF